MRTRSTATQLSYPHYTPTTTAKRKRRTSLHRVVVEEEVSLLVGWGFVSLSFPFFCSLSHHAPAHRPISMPRTRPRVASNTAPHTNAGRLRLPSPPLSLPLPSAAPLPRVRPSMQLPRRLDVRAPAPRNTTPTRTRSQRRAPQLRRHTHSTLPSLGIILSAPIAPPL
jgi:hypothetical protein